MTDTTSGNAAVRWAALKEEWLVQNLAMTDGGTFSFKALAEMHGLSHGTVRNHAAKYKWHEELKVRASNVQERVVEAVQTSIVETELQVRMRHATVSKFALSKGLERIRNISSETLTPREAIDLMRIGMEYERRSYGFRDQYEFWVHQNRPDNSTPEHMSVIRAQAVIGDLISALETPEDAEYETAEEVS